MSKQLTLISAAVVVTSALVACSVQEPNDAVGKSSSSAIKMEFNAGCATKTVLDGKSIKWQSGDAICIFDGESNNKFTTNSSGSYAVFKGCAKPAAAFYAAYPYNADFSISEDVISATIPSVQPGVAGGFAPNVNLSVGKTSDTNLSMKNVCGYVKFVLSRYNITKVTLSAPGEEKIAGVVNVAIGEDGVPVCSPSGSAVSTVVMTPSEGNVFVPGTYYFCLAPGVLSEGISIEIKDSAEKTYTKVVPVADAILRSTPLYVGVIDENFDVFVPTLKLDPATRTTISPDDRSATIYLETNCEDVTAAVADGASLGDVVVTKESNSIFTVTFTNSSDDPQHFNSATIVFSAGGAQDLEVVIRQNGILTLDFTDTNNPFGIVTATTTDENSFELTTAADNTYMFKYVRSLWRTKKNTFQFKQVAAEPYGYLSFPAIPGLTLKKAHITVKYYESSLVKLYAKISLYGDFVQQYAARIDTIVSAEETEKTASYVLEEPSANTSYMLTSNQNADCNIKQIALIYE